jgi:hypothetical protein
LRISTPIASKLTEQSLQCVQESPEVFPAAGCHDFRREEPGQIGFNGLPKPLAFHLDHDPLTQIFRFEGDAPDLRLLASTLRENRQLPWPKVSDALPRNGGPDVLQQRLEQRGIQVGDKVEIFGEPPAVVAPAKGRAPLKDEP